MGSERCIERDGALLGQRRSGALVDGGRSHQADSAMAGFVVVPGEELLAVSASVLDRAEAIGGSEQTKSHFTICSYPIDLEWLLCGGFYIQAIVMFAIKAD